MAERKKRNGNREETKSGAPAWMVTFGDLMSLLLTFFVLIVSFSSIELVKFQKALGSLKGALGVLPQNETIVIQNEPIIPQLSDFQERRIRRAAAELQKMIKEQGINDQVKLEVTDDGIIVRIDSPILFRLGEAELKPEALPILDRVIEMTRDWPNQIRIEGHTDDLPIRTPQFPSNWDLSAARALSVLKYFLQNGQIEPNRLAAVGYGEYHPLVPNSNEENRAKNRRVEIYIQHKKEKSLFRDAIF